MKYKNLQEKIENIDLDNLSEDDVLLIETTIKVANGRLTCAEALGHREFVMTKLYRSA